MRWRKSWQKKSTSRDPPAKSGCHCLFPVNCRSLERKGDRKLSDFASDFARGRRHLLRSTAAWVGATAAFAATRSAGAWQVREIDPASALGAAYAKRCGGPSD